MAEDFAIGTSSPRNVCVDGVSSSDVCIVIVADRGGWKAPTGKLVVEEEYEAAKRLHRVIAVYVRNGTRDADAERLVNTLTDYVSGHFRATFDNCADLERVLRNKLPAILAPLDLPMTRNDVIDRKLSDPDTVQYETTMRVVIVPERQEEVIDKLTIGTKAFEEDVLAIAHDRNVRLLDYRSAKSSRLDRNALVIEEHPQAHYSGAPASGRIVLTPDGIVSIDAVVSFSSTSADDIAGTTATFFLLKPDVLAALNSAFSFAGELFQKIEPYKRHQRFQYGAVFTGISIARRARRRRSSYSMARNLEELLVIEAGRLIGRDVLELPTNEGARIATLVEREIGG